MTIDNYTDANAHTADSFSFPYNPLVYDVQMTNFVDPRNYAYAFTYFGATSSIKSRQDGVITGHMSGTNKNTNFRSLAAHFNSNKIKRLFFGTDKFMIMIPQTIKRTFAGGRTNFIDYVATFSSPFGLLFDNTQQSGAYNSALTNAGNVATPIEKITGSVTSGQQVTIADKDGNGFTFTANASGTMTMYLVTMLNLGSDIYITNYLYVLVGTTPQVVKSANTNKSQMIQVASGQSIATLFTAGTITNITPTFYWRSGWSAD